MRSCRRTTSWSHSSTPSSAARDSRSGLFVAVEAHRHRLARIDVDPDPSVAQAILATHQDPHPIAGPRLENGLDPAAHGHAVDLEYDLRMLTGVDVPAVRRQAGLEPEVVGVLGIAQLDPNNQRQNNNCLVESPTSSRLGVFLHTIANAELGGPSGTSFRQAFNGPSSRSSPTPRQRP